MSAVALMLQTRVVSELQEFRKTIAALDARPIPPAGMQASEVEQLINNIVSDLRQLIRAVDEKPLPKIPPPGLKAQQVSTLIQEAMTPIEDRLREVEKLPAAMLPQMLTPEKVAAMLEARIAPILAQVDKRATSRTAPAAREQKGANGWSPLLRLVHRAGRVVMELYDWTGGDGDKPATGFIGADGLIDDARRATNLRGDDGVAYGGGGGLTEAQILQLIEDAMPVTDVEYARIVTTLTTAGANTLHTPAAGQAIRVRRIKCTADPDSADTPMLTLRLGEKLIQRGPVLYGADYVEGAVDDPLILDMESDAEVGVTILYEEFTPA